MRTTQERIEKNITDFTSYYSLVLSIFLGLAGLSQFINASNTLSYINFDVVCNKATSTPLYLVVPWVFKKIVITFVLMAPVILLWLAGQKISSFVIQIANEIANGNNLFRSDLIFITKIILIPFLLLFLSVAGLCCISMSSGSATGVVFWTTNFLFTIFVFFCIFFKVLLTAR